MSPVSPYQAQLDQLAKQILETKGLLADPEMTEMAQTEIARLENEQQVLQQAAAAYAEGQQGGESEIVGELGSSCTLEFRAGAGGDEAKIWADDLRRMYLRFAEHQKLKVTVIDDDVLRFKGQLKIETPEGEQVLTCYQFLQFESGVHRVQRVPETEAQGRIHTSTATVAVLPEVPKTAVAVREEELEWQFMRSSGAGGQSVNKTNSAVRLTHIPSGIVVTARSERSQVQNRENALGLLRSQLWEIEEEKRLAQIGTARSAIGRAKRAEKIRTYNFPQNRVTDHRTKQSWHNLFSFLEGNLIEPLTELYLELSTD